MIIPIAIFAISLMRLAMKYLPKFLLIITINLFLLLIFCSNLERENKYDPESEYYVAPRPILNWDNPEIITESENGNVTIKAILNKATTKDVTTSISIEGNARIDTDFTINKTDLVIPAGEISATIEISIIDDSIYEGNEDIILNLIDVKNASHSSRSISKLIITDDDSIPTVELSPAITTFSEDSSGVILTATLSNRSYQDINITVELSFSGAAVKLTDFMSADQIEIPAEMLQGSIVISSINENIYEEDEDIIIDIESVINAGELGTQTVTATIENDDQ